MKRSDDEVVLLRMMALGYLDIRAPSKPSMPHIIADIYHNIPSGLTHGADPKELLERAKVIAERHGVIGYVQSAEKYARRTMND